MMEVRRRILVLDVPVAERLPLQFESFIPGLQRQMQTALWIYRANQRVVIQTTASNPQQASQAPAPAWS